MRRSTLWILLGLLVLVVLAVFFWTRPALAPPEASVYIPPPQTQEEGCELRGPLPDPECSPGAVFADITAKEICVSGYSRSVRNVSESLKKQVYKSYGVSSRAPGQYEMDHLISLELGGSNDAANLFAEPAEPPPGFHEKDALENRLHALVCKGSISLYEAQKAIATDWVGAWERYVGRD